MNLLKKVSEMMSSGIIKDFSVRLLNEPGYNGRMYCEYIAEALERGKIFEFVNLGNYSTSRLYSKEYENCMWVTIDPQNITFEELCENFEVYNDMVATVYKGNIIKNLIMDCQSYTKYRPNETTGGIFVSWRRKEELPTGLD